MANRKKQYCPQGHDTFLVGRLNGGCNICRKETSRRRTREHPELTRAAVKRWADTHKDWKRNKDYQRTYGITLKDYWRMHKDQNGCCIICTTQTDLVVDHNHRTRRVRGLLCGSCNRGIGYLKDSPENLSRAIEYLKKLSPVLVHQA